VRAWLLAPVALDAREGMPLDGVLSWAVALAASREMPDDAFAGVPRGRFVDLPVPLAETTIEGHAIARASWATPSPDARSLVRRRRKRADVEAYGLAGKVPTNGGEWKSLDLPVPAVAATWLEWWCVGDRAQVAAALSLVHGLGRDRARGVATVEGWEVDRVTEDRSLVWEGLPTRALPVRDLADCEARYPGARPIVTAARAPYWRRDTRALCACPVAAC
jgi:hypothetical protein